MSVRRGQLAAAAGVLEQRPGRPAVHLAQLGADAIDFRIAALGDQRADHAAAGRRRPQRRRAHEQGEQVRLEPAASRPPAAAPASVGQRRDDQLGPGRPAPVDRRLVDAGPAGDVVDAQPAEAVAAEHLEGGLQDARDDPGAAPADPRLRRSGSGPAGRTERRWRQWRAAAGARGRRGSAYPAY